MNREIQNTDDMIDSRDIIARIAELTDDAGIELSDAEAEELAALLKLQDEAEGYSPDWKYGATLIRDSYFEDYAHELASDLGAISVDAQWPYNCIDWERAARELQMDYTAVDFDGVTYWIH